MPNWQLEAQLWQRGYPLIAGIDEAGRGALAGPVVAAAVILPHNDYPYRDSKQLKAEARDALARDIRQRALAYGLGFASPKEVDQLNVLGATHLAAKRALAHLGLEPTALVTDYLKLAFRGPVRAVARADDASLQVAAASILAKTTRDAYMTAQAPNFPAYRFASNKGYGAPEHLGALQRLGPCELHRYSFKPVAQGKLF